MKKLDTKTFQNLKKESASKVLNAKQEWYDLSYPIFSTSSIKEINDLWKVVAFAYSWMPTIPKVRHHLIHDEKKLIKDLNLLKKGKLKEKEDLIKLLVPVINNSLVGTSKVLHFIAPAQVPIIDSRVLRGWKSFFQKYPEYDVPKLPSAKVSLNIKHVNGYIKYWETLKGWKEECNFNVTFREIEFCFYKLGTE